VHGLLGKLDVQALDLDVEVVLDRGFDGFGKTERSFASADADSRAGSLLGYGELA
jgi:hypothetical protein